MLSARFRCTAIAEWSDDKSMHVATLIEISASSKLTDTAFGLVKEGVRLLVPPHKLVVGRTYTLRIEEMAQHEGTNSS
jgi:hypothetical protein